MLYVRVRYVYIVGFRLFKTIFKLQDQRSLSAEDAQAMVFSEKQYSLKQPGGGGDSNFRKKSVTDVIFISSQNRCRLRLVLGSARYTPSSPRKHWSKIHSQIITNIGRASILRAYAAAYFKVPSRQENPQSGKENRAGTFQVLLLHNPGQCKTNRYTGFLIILITGDVTGTAFHSQWLHVYDLSYKIYHLPLSTVF
jgi:hypothetical protein